MNDAGGAPWSGAEQFQALDATAEHDFGNLIDFDNIDLDEFNKFNQIDFGDGGHDAQQLGELAESLGGQHLHNPFSPVGVTQEHPSGTASGSQQSIENHGIPTTGDNFFHFSMPPYSQATTATFSQAEQIFRPHHAVPPTPNSIEMHGDPGRYLQQIDPQQALYDQRYHMRKDDSSFTPLVSPAVTPHEARFQVQEMTTVPGAYFSPLTSPALNAQNHQHAQHHSSHYTTSGSSTGASPVDVDMEMLGEAAMASSEQGRKLRSSSRRTAPRPSTAAGRVRQSPIVKPARRKATVSSLIPPKEVTELVQEARANRYTSSGLHAPRSREGSEADSISPEPMLEMGPPPKPGSVTQSPAIVAQNQQTAAQGVVPATPASLMRIHPSPTLGTPDVPPALDDLTLPEASLDRPALSRIDTAIPDCDQDTPRLSARKTPKLGPLSTPSGAVAQSGKPSPMLSAVSSPTSPAFATGAVKRGDAKAGRMSKKRNSVSSNLVSPALRPKISPSIKPLLPDGAVSDETHALLLASKSNYQNILDGTTVPGVVYPTSLSTNLTSKRTSHKIAEQGRRNRINTALQEMQALLPSPQINAKDSKSPESAASQSNNSKAAKVESAIEYIKQLQKQCLDKDRLLDQKDQEMEALRKELDALRRGNADAQTSSPEPIAQTTETSMSPTKVNDT